MKKVVCLEKYSKSVAFWGNLVRKKKIPNLSVEEMLDKYKGFESENIDFLPTDKYESNLNEWLKRLTEIRSEGVILGVCLEADSENSFDKRFSLAGYDFGTCEEDKTVFYFVA